MREAWERVVFPAPAGINRDALGRLVFTERVPRASGDKLG
ncbi:hypothetical protein predicted by Glimmer/Critica [Salmonella enterica subsp. enterica serovar Weltevreden str. 2007-60-3289-1]|nr:hypothetical protein predicted by Glimmer/Critica [Salmonella enterica subsp. enterica serovar Weltevreden str. 2007-60-3289-1]